MEEAFTIKALLYALVLTVEESRKFNDKSKTKQRGRPMRCIMYIPRVLTGTCVLAGMCGLSIHIYTGVGLSALLVSICRAMREPFYRGTSNRNRSTLFCLCMINEETRTAIAGATGHTNRNTSIWFRN